MILYIKDTKDSTRKLLHLINTFSKGTETKINTGKLVTFLFANNKHTKKEIMEAITFTKVS